MGPLVLCKYEEVKIHAVLWNMCCKLFPDRAIYLCIFGKSDIIDPGDTMIILGIDPGTAICGYGLIENTNYRLRPIDCGTINTPAGMDLDQRLVAIYNGISELIDTYHPNECSVEELFFNTNTRTALSVGQARGVILLAAAHKQVPIFEYTPLQVKQAIVGYGRADKKANSIYGENIAEFTGHSRPDERGGWFGPAICHAHSRKIMLEGKVDSIHSRKNRLNR